MQGDWWDSNPQPPGPHPGALPLSYSHSSQVWIRTKATEFRAPRATSYTTWDRTAGVVGIEPTQRVLETHSPALDMHPFVLR